MSVIPVTSDVTVVASGEPAVLDAWTLEQVDDLWAAELRSRPGLVDNLLFSVDRVDSAVVIGHFVPYRWFIAQLRRPGLRSRLAVAPLAVTGRTMTRDQTVVLGRRAQHTTQDPGRWEFVPSGGVDTSARNESGRIDLVVALEHELVEELGVQREECASAALQAIVVDPSGVHDVIVDVRITLETAEVTERVARIGHPEHDELRYLSLEDVMDVLGAEALGAATQAAITLPWTDARS